MRTWTGRAADVPKPTVANPHVVGFLPPAPQLDGTQVAVLGGAMLVKTAPCGWRRWMKEAGRMTDVLLVDDSATIRKTATLILEDAGYHVFQANSGRTAYELLIAHAQGMVVLLDLAMPGMDGQALLEAFHEQPSLAARHRMVVVTAYADATLPLRLANLLSALEVPVLGKPFSVDDLLAAVAKAEQGRAQR
jgi:CheY-like chemotaxis protein